MRTGTMTRPRSKAALVMACCMAVVIGLVATTAHTQTADPCERTKSKCVRTLVERFAPLSRAGRAPEPRRGHRVLLESHGRFQQSGRETAAGTGSRRGGLPTDWERGGDRNQDRRVRARRRDGARSELPGPDPEPLLSEQEEVCQRQGSGAARVLRQGRSRRRLSPEDEATVRRQPSPPPRPRKVALPSSRHRATVSRSMTRLHSRPRSTPSSTTSSVRPIPEGNVSADANAYADTHPHAVADLDNSGRMLLRRRREWPMRSVRPSAPSSGWSGCGPDFTCTPSCNCACPTKVTLSTSAS